MGYLWDIYDSILHVIWKFQGKQFQKFIEITILIEKL